jgi:hypothetical protein
MTSRLENLIVFSVVFGVVFSLFYRESKPPRIALEDLKEIRRDINRINKTIDILENNNLIVAEKLGIKTDPINVYEKTDI